MDGLISVNPGAIIWTLINFSILMILLGKFAFPMITKALKERETGIENAIINANEANKKAQELLIESQKKVDEAYLEVKEILAGGKKNAELIVQKALNEAEIVKKAKLDETLKEIESSKNKALQELRNEVADLVLLATEKVIQAKLNDNEHINIVKNYLDKLPKN